MTHILIYLASFLLAYLVTSLWVGGDPFFLFRKVIWIKDAFGVVRKTREFKKKDGTVYSYVYGSTRTGELTLGPNNDVIPNDDVTYVQYWSYNKKDLDDKVSKYAD